MSSGSFKTGRSLFDRARNEEPGAWFAYVDASLPRIAAHLRRRSSGLSPWEIFEVCFDALCEVGLRLDELDCPERALAYARTVALNKARRLARKRRDVPPHVPLDAAAVDMPYAQEARFGDQSECTFTGIRDVLWSLSRQDRELLQMMLERDLSVTDVARYLAISERTLRRRLLELREKLQDR
jgi:RNA polymerase sigma factor (sigma-70 family)